MLYTVKKGRDKIVALFLDPPSDKGRATLRLGDNMWLYIPERRQADTDHQPAVGDRRRVQQRRHPARRLQRRVQRGQRPRRPRNSYVLSLKAQAPAKSPTTGSRCGSTSKRCCRSRSRPMPRAACCIKTLHFKDIKDFGGGIKRPATLETDSPLYKGYKSVMLCSGIKKRAASRTRCSRSTTSRAPASCAEPCGGCSAPA